MAFVSEAEAVLEHKSVTMARLHGADTLRAELGLAQIAQCRNQQESRKLCNICLCKVATGWHC